MAPAPPAEIAGAEVDPAGIGTWDGMDKKFADHKLARYARQSTIMCNVASETIPYCAEMRHTGGEELWRTSARAGKYSGGLGFFQHSGWKNIGISLRNARGGGTIPAEPMGFVF